MKRYFFILIALLCVASIFTDDDKESSDIWISLPRFLHDVDSRYISISSVKHSAENLGLSPPVVPPDVSIPFGEQIMEGPDIHLGVDLSVAVGTPIRTAGKGMVEVVDYDPMGFGSYVVVYHGGRLYTIYGHMDKITVEKGAFVDTGTIVGYSGQSGLALTPCLHFAILRAVSENGYYLNPVSLFEQTQQ